VIETLHRWDCALLLKLNAIHSPFWDTLMSAATGRFFWIPLYLLLLGLIIVRFRKKTLLILPMLALMVLLADQSSRLMKSSCKRERPCYNETISGQLNVYDGCGGRYGFVSSHAANTFGLAMFMFLLWKGRRGRRWMLLVFLFAIFASYTRIYLGVHYPLDIAGGAIVGMLSAWVVILIYRKWIEGLIKE